MALIRKTVTVTAALVGGVLFSQAPEFSQQYRQRLGGALDELRVIVTDFDNQSMQAGLGRESALALYSSSAESFLRDRGTSMRQTFNRYAALTTQQEELVRAPALARPFYVLKYPDPMIVENAWQDFVPGVPVSISGAAWTTAGAGAAALVFGLMTRLFRRRGPKVYVTR